MSECGSAVYQCCLQVLRPHYRDTLCATLASHLLQHGLANITAPQYQDEYQEQDHSDLHPVFHAMPTCKLFEVRSKSRAVLSIYILN